MDREIKPGDMVIVKDTGAIGRVSCISSGYGYPKDQYSVKFGQYVWRVHYLEELETAEGLDLIYG